MIHTIDLQFLGNAQTIASFLVITDQNQPILVESGPHSTLPTLTKAVENLGYKLTDIKHVFLTHIHLDHAGAAWALAQHGATVYVHPFGAPHLAHPEKLMESAKRIYQEKMEMLWGDMQPIPENQLVQVTDKQTFTIDNLTFVGHHTPGHAVHHIAWQVGEAVFAGDVAGVKIGDGPVVAPLPPPDIDIEAWHASIQLLRDLKASRMFLTHFGEITNIDAQLEQLGANINLQADWVRVRWEAGQTVEQMLPDFVQFCQGELKKQGVADIELFKYEGANPAFMSATGLVRYWKKKLSA
ncbi:MAG: MBL fold metallo-hydrolase [Bacteroidetes bacterium]|nr:MAG: MBL fold metallo-hydrolase [Bacteroidota bacterium]